MHVYHFIDAKWGLENIKRKRLKLSRLSDLNDPFELLALELSDSNLRNAILETKEELNQKTGILCFSDRWTNPVMWSHYADKHRGICLEFDIPDTNLAKISYCLSRLKDELTELFDTDSNVAERAMRKCLTTKFAHWKYESEWRAFFELNQPDEGGHYFANFDNNLRLTGVIVGPRSTVSRNDLKLALLESGLGYTPTAFQARLAFKSFKVVKNRKQDLWSL
jgi:hypothetical protein